MTNNKSDKRRFVELVVSIPVVILFLIVAVYLIVQFDLISVIVDMTRVK